VSRAYDRKAHVRASRSIRGLPCHWCGAPSTQLDHITALADGGAGFDPQNLAPSCAPCNQARGREVALRHQRGMGSPSRRW